MNPSTEPTTQVFKDAVEFYSGWSEAVFVAHVHGFDVWKAYPDGAYVIIAWGNRGDDDHETDAGILWGEVSPEDITSRIQAWSGTPIPEPLRPRIPELAAWIHSYLTLLQ